MPMTVFTRVVLATLLSVCAAGTKQARGAESPAPAPSAAMETNDVVAFVSDRVSGDSPGIPISLDVTGRRWMHLVGLVEEGVGNCHIWGEARLIAKDGSVTPLADLTPASVHVGWGQLLVNHNWQDQPLKIGNRTFSHGIWVHADSDVCYALNGRYERFEAWVGVDAARAVGAARFKVLFDPTDPPELPPEWDSQYAALEHDIRNRAAFERVAPETLRPESLILEADRDPLDVVLRRTAALLAELRHRAETPELAARARELGELTAKAGAINPARRQARRELCAAACRLRREIAFANPLLDFSQIVFVKHHRALMNHMCDQYYGMAAMPGGGLYVLENAFGDSPHTRDLLANAVVANGRLKGTRLDGGSPARQDVRFDGQGNRSGTERPGGAFLSPDLSYDGKQVLFAYVECTGDMRHHHHTDPSRGHSDAGRCYHIFRVGADGNDLRQLTDGTWNDFDPCWMPGGRIAFISERRGGYLRCGRTCPLYTLYDMAADGGDIRCLSRHESNEWHPSVTHDGMIIWTRWDYVDRYGCIAHAPWLTTPEGRDPRPLLGNYAPRRGRPDMMLDCRAVPGSHRIVATAAPHHGQAYGSLVLLDPHVPDDDGMAAIKRITPDVGFPESQGGREAYGSPWPLDETFYLCVYDATMALTGNRGPGSGDYGIYLVDAFGNRELLYRDPEISALCPIPLRARPVPHVTAELARGENAPDPSATNAVPEATLALVNVYESLKPFPAGTRIAALRVLQVLPMSVPSGRPPHETGQRMASARDSVVPCRRVLGTAPVESDGSACFIVPAERELFFQALDENGLAVQSMRSATCLRAGEQLTCAGCHEPKQLTVPAPQTPPIAMRRAPSRLTPDVEGSNPFSYPLLVQPVLDRNCVACHAKHPDKAPNLAREPITRKWYASYNSLVDKYGFHDYGDGYRTTPGRFGALASRLYTILRNGHHGLTLSPEDLHRITLWLDCSSMFYGVYEDEGGQAQLRAEVATPTLE